METPPEFELHVPVEETETLAEDEPDYNPVEGVDYLVDLYALSGVARDASREDIDRAIKSKMKEYHPDRLQGLAPKFLATGNQTTVLLIRARHVLLDDGRRQEYDDLLGHWEGPLTDSDIPAITIQRYHQTKALLKSPKALEADVTDLRKRLEQMTGYKPSRITLMESLLATVDEEARPALLEELADELSQQDLLLGAEEAYRMQLLGVDTEGRKDFLGPGYSNQVVGELDIINDSQAQAARQRAEGNVVERLALLTGETIGEESQIVAAVSNLDTRFPAHFNNQAQRIKEIAEEREALLQRRLANLEPDYPCVEAQTEIQPTFILGVEFHDQTSWFAFAYEYDAENNMVNAASFDYGQEISDLLDLCDYAKIIEMGFNIFTVKYLERVEPVVIINTAIDKHLKRFKVTKD